MQPQQPGELHLDILDVGQGDGMVISLPNGKVMMVDYGTTSIIQNPM